MLKRLSILLASLVLTVSASATPLAFTKTIQLGTLDGGGVAGVTGFIGGTDATGSETLSLFDTDLGTLTGASLTVKGNSSSALSLVNLVDGGGAIDGTTFLVTTFKLGADLVGSELVAIDQALSCPGIAQNAGCDHMFSEVGSLTFDLFAVLDPLSSTTPNTFEFTCSATSSVSSGQTTTEASAANTSECIATITYTYDAAGPTTSVPEPSSLALVGLALAVIGFSTRRRKS